MARRAFEMLARTYALWREDNAPHVAAALTYYVLLSTAPLLVVLVGVLGSYLGRSTVTRQIVLQAGTLAGELGTRTVREFIAAAAPSSGGSAISAVAIIVALAGAMRVFGELRTMFMRMWEAPPEDPPPGSLVERAKWWLSRQGRHKLAAFVMVLVVGALLGASLAASAVLGLLAEAVPPVLPVGPQLVRLLDPLVSMLLLAVLFAVAYRYLPGIPVTWRDVFVGALATAALFILGRIALGTYFTHAAPGSAYGAAGSLVALLIWVNFSIQVALFGAEFTYLWAHEQGSRRHEPTREPSKVRAPH